MNTYHEVTGTTDEGTIVLLHLDGHPPVAFDRRMFVLLAERRGWPDGIRGRVRVVDGAVIYEDEEELS